VEIFATLVSVASPTRISGSTFHDEEVDWFLLTPLSGKDFAFLSWSFSSEAKAEKEEG